MNDFTGQAERVHVARGEDCGPPAGNHDRREIAGPDDDDDPTPIKKVERAITPWIAIFSAIAISISTMVGWGVLSQPFQTKAMAAGAQAKTDERFREIDAIDARHDEDIKALASGVAEIRTDVKEGKELQLMDRLAVIAERMKAAPPGSDLYNDYLGQQTELRQRLTKVRKELGR